MLFLNICLENTEETSVKTQKTDSNTLGSQAHILVDPICIYNVVRPIQIKQCSILSDRVTQHPTLSAPSP